MTPQAHSHRPFAVTISCGREVSYFDAQKLALCRREAYLGRAIVRPQALRRGAVQRRAFLAARGATVRLQAAARGMLVRRRVAAMRAAAVIVQARFRGYRAREAIRRQQVSSVYATRCA